MRPAVALLPRPLPLPQPLPYLHHARGPLPDPHQAAAHLQMAAVARPQSLAHPQPQG
jgi:hypothetical protein